MIEWMSLATAFLLGLLSSAHCVGMCGGIMGALTMAIPAEARQRRLQLLLSYNFGRIASYVLMGILLGLFASVFSQWSGNGWLRIVAGVLMILMGLYLADWWRGLVYLERVGRHLWAYLQPLGKSFLPVTSARKALFLGAIWGWLPCGLVYSALAYAMAQAHPLAAGSTMLAFGLGTLPAVLLTGLAAQQLTGLLQRRYVRAGFAVLVILFGLWTIRGGLGHEHHHEHAPAGIEANHEGSSSMGHSHHSH